MRDYVIFTDSTIDLTAEMVSELGVEVLPLEFTIQGKSYKDYPDNRELDPHTFYEIVRTGEQPQTSQINTSAYLENIEPVLKSGKDVLIIAFSSALSGTYQSSVLAVEELSEKYPEAKVITIDSKSASMGEGLLVWHAVMRKNAGMGIDELAQWLSDNRLRLCHWFTVDDLNHLKRGGRVSAASALVGTLLGIKPVLHVDDEGRLIPMSKIRGRRQSLDALFNEMAKTYDSSEKQTIFISHGDCEADAKYLADKVRSQLNVKDVFLNYVGPVIGAHSGPGTIALFFMGSKR